MILEEYKNKKTKKALNALNCVLDNGLKEDKSKEYAVVTVLALIGFGALACVSGINEDLEFLQYASIPLLIGGMVSGCKAYEVTNYDLSAEDMYEYIIELQPEIANKNKEDVKVILTKFKNLNNEINAQKYGAKMKRDKKHKIEKFYAEQLDELKEM